MTELAYLADMPSAYVRTFRARIVSLPPGGVVLGRTFFYPAGGGQPGDRGTLRLDDGTEVAVVDVVRSGPSVLHRVRAPPAVVHRLGAGVEVEVTLDWERRHRHMRLHTAQHLLSARVFVRTRLRTRKAVLAGLRATIDLEGSLPPGLERELANDLASVVDEDRPVTILQVPRREWDREPTAERSGLVPLPPQVDPVRVIAIDRSDVCPCGGTHVRSTGEIGRVTVEPAVPPPDRGSRLTVTLDGSGPPTASA